MASHVYYTLFLCGKKENETVREGGDLGYATRKRIKRRYGANKSHTQKPKALTLEKSLHV